MAGLAFVGLAPGDSGAGSHDAAMVLIGDMGMEPECIDMRIDILAGSTPRAAQLGICSGPWAIAALDYVKLPNPDF